MYSPTAWRRGSYSNIRFVPHRTIRKPGILTHGGPYEFARTHLRGAGKSRLTPARSRRRYAAGDEHLVGDLFRPDRGCRGSTGCVSTGQRNQFTPEDLRSGDGMAIRAIPAALR